jgi:hypothetical protein
MRTWYGTSLQKLPHPIDDVTAEFGDDLYLRMLRDPKVHGAVTIFKAAILEDGLRVSPAINDATDPNYELAATIADAARRMFGNLRTPVNRALWGLLDAVSFGNRVAELVWEVRDDPFTGQTRLDLAAMKLKNRRVVSFVVDPYLNVWGLIAAQPRLGPAMATAPVAAGRLLTDQDRQYILPREKFAIYSFRPQDDDPRGTSILRAAYAPWWRKQQIAQEWLRYLTQFASPGLIGYTAPGSQEQPAQDDLGNAILDDEGNMKMLTPEEAMLNTLLTFANGTAISLPNGAKVDLVQSRGEGQAFLSGFSFEDGQIITAILTQTLATEEGQHQARAAAQVHLDVLETLVRQGKQDIEQVLHDDILYNWVAWNWGDDEARTLTPRATLGSTEQRQVPALMAAVAQLFASGYFTDDQLPEIDTRLGFPVRLIQAPVEPPVPEPAPAPAPTGGPGAPEPAPAPAPGAPAPTPAPAPAGAGAPTAG